MYRNLRYLRQQRGNTERNAFQRCYYYYYIFRVVENSERNRRTVKYDLYVKRVDSARYEVVLWSTKCRQGQ